MRTDLLAELEPVVEANLNRHLNVAKEWFPHEYVPWSEGRDFTEQPWAPEQSRLSPEVQAALELNLVTEDNLPAYHYVVASRFGLDGPWGQWVNRWTAEEGRHAQVIRDYLLVTRGVDPVRLERWRMSAMSGGYDGSRSDALEAMVYVSFQELATRVAHRNTGAATGDPVAERLLARIAADENLHMIFYRSLVDAALQIDPSATVLAVLAKLREFGMPAREATGFARRSLVIARAGIFSLRIHLDDVVRPLLRHWDYFALGGLTGEAQRAQDELADLLDGIDRTASRQLEQIEAGRERRRRLQDARA